MKIVFLDRDGVINEYPGDRDYIKSPDEFSFIPKAKAALKYLNSAGYKIFIISNQAGVSKGIYTKEDLKQITDKMIQGLKSEGIDIEKVAYCLHRPEDNCLCRKPNTGMIDSILHQLKATGAAIALNKTYFVGDSIIDVKTGKAAGLKTILVLSGKESLKNKENWQSLPDNVAADLAEAAGIILKN